MRKGDTLLNGSYLEFDYTETRLFSTSNNRNKNDVNTNRIIRTDKELALKRLDKKHLSIELAQLKKELKKLQELKSLELIQKGKIEKQKILIQNTSYKIAELDDEITVLTSYRKRLEQQLKTGKPMPVPVPSFLRSNTYVASSPNDGQVTSVYLKDSEIALKGETILTIVSPGKPLIKGYFEQKNINYIEKGKSVRIKFPSGLSATGTIERFYRSTLPPPEEFHKTYKQAERRLVVDIVPQSNDGDWTKRHFLGVTLHIKRYF